MTNILTQISTSAIARCLAVAFVASASFNLSALSPDYYTSNSRLSTGRWVKVRVANEGIQQITYDQLREWGFANPENVKVYGFGGTWMSDHAFSADKPDDVLPTLSIHTSDGRLLFFGDSDHYAKISGKSEYYTYEASVTRNFFDVAGCYLLTDEDAGGETTQPIAYTPLESVAPHDTHVCLELFEEENIVSGPQTNIFHSVQYEAGDVVSVPFDITDYVYNEDIPSSVAFEMAILNTKAYSSYQLSEISCEGLDMTSKKRAGVGNVTDSSLKYQTGIGISLVLSEDEETNVIDDGTYTFKATTPSSTYISYMALDRAYLLYTRKNIMRDNKTMILNFPIVTNGDNFAIEGASEGMHVWNISDPSKVVEQEGDLSDGTFTGSFDKAYVATGSSGACRLIAFNENQTHNTVTYAGVVENQNIHGDATPDMLIVTTDEMLPYANQLADMHREHDGFVVNVYTQEQLFNEFGAGNRSSMAIRRAAKMFYDRDPQKFKYIVMYGRNFYDSRNLSNETLSYVPLIQYEVEATTSELTYAASYTNINFGSDDYYGYLDDDDTASSLISRTGTLDIAVGRIPAINAAYANDINTKIANYFVTPIPADVMMRTLVASDSGDDNKHLNQSLGLVEIYNDNNKAMTVTQGHTMIYPHTSASAPILREVEAKTLKEGVGVFCYNGHGSSIAFSGTNLMTTNSVNTTSYKYAPIAMLATCSSLHNDFKSLGIGDAMLRKSDGGAIAIVGSGRTVYLDANKYMCESFVNAYTSLSGEITVGELYRQTHNAANAADVVNRFRVNNSCYCLAGDPALKIHLPDQKIAVTEINNVDVTEAEALSELSPMSTVNVKAQVLNADGEVDTNFNGSATLTLYEAPHDVSTIIVSSSDKDATVSLDEEAMSSVTVAVTNGEISANLYLPYNTYASSVENTNRLSIVAVADAGEIATGYSCQAYISDESESELEFAGTLPEITDMYINTPDFDVTQETCSTVTLVATVTIGDAGISTSSAMGKEAYLFVDGTKVTSESLDITTNTDGTATVKYTTSGLSDGAHSFTLNVSDLVGNRVEQSLDFLVGTNVALVADKQKVYDDIEFDIEHTYADTPECRLIVEDLQHNTVLSVENAQFPYTLSTKDGDTQTFAEGFYSAYVITQGASTYRSSDKVNFVVVR